MNLRWYLLIRLGYLFHHEGSVKLRISPQIFFRYHFFERQSWSVVIWALFFFSFAKILQFIQTVAYSLEFVNGKIHFVLVHILKKIVQGAGSPSSRIDLFQDHLKCLFYLIPFSSSIKNSSFQFCNLSKSFNIFFSPQLFVTQSRYCMISLVSKNYKYY